MHFPPVLQFKTEKYKWENRQKRQTKQGKEKTDEVLQSVV